MLRQNILSSEIKQGSNNEMYQASFVCCILNRVANKCLKLWWGDRGGCNLLFCCAMLTVRIPLIVSKDRIPGIGVQWDNTGEGENYRRETQAAQCLPSHTTIHLHFSLLYILLIFTCLPHYLVIS